MPLVAPRKVAPSKKETFVTLPSLSWAEAVIVILAGPVNEAPLAGESIFTDGGELGGCGVERR